MVHDLLDILISDIVEVQQGGPTFYKSIDQLLVFLGMAIMIRDFLFGDKPLDLFFCPDFLLLFYPFSDIIDCKEFLAACDHILEADPCASALGSPSFLNRLELLSHVKVLSVQESFRRRSRASLALLTTLDALLVALITPVDNFHGVEINPMSRIHQKAF